MSYTVTVDRYHSLLLCFRTLTCDFSEQTTYAERGREGCLQSHRQVKHGYLYTGTRYRCIWVVDGPANGLR